MKKLFIPFIQSRGHGYLQIDKEGLITVIATGMKRKEFPFPDVIKLTDISEIETLLQYVEMMTGLREMMPLGFRRME